MKRCALLFILAAMIAPAAAGPSFDCAKAATAVEKTVCSDENAELALRDAALARLYGALKEHGGHDKVLGGQSAWLGSRDACGSDAKCLIKRYDERLAVLAREAGDENGVTGSYSYRLSADTDDGSAFVVREADGGLSGAISTVSGPTYHTCEVTFEAANAIGDAWVWDDPAASGGAEDFCRILLRPGQDTLRIDSGSCQTYCGARGFFDETYKRTK